MRVGARLRLRSRCLWNVVLLLSAATGFCSCAEVEGSTPQRQLQQANNITAIITTATPPTNCNTDSTQSNWGMRLLNHTPQQALGQQEGVVRECFVISRDVNCTASVGNHCCNQAKGPTRAAVLLETTGGCSDVLLRMNWTLDGRVARMRRRSGYITTPRLGHWRPGVMTKQLCVEITPGAGGQCSTLSDICMGKDRCIFKLYSTVPTNLTKCCLEGDTVDAAAVGGDAEPVSPLTAEAVNKAKDAFASMLLAATALRTAVKEADPQAAAAALKVTTSDVPNLSNEAQEGYAQNVIMQAEIPEFNGTALNTPVKSQGRSTMAASYAAVATLEATVAAAFYAGNTTGINFSEKALHWCDAARPAVAELMLNGVLTNTSSSPTIDGWYGPTAMATLSLYGAVNSSCYGDAVGVQSPLTQLGVMGGTCSSVLASCSRLKGFRYVDLTPQSNLTGFTPVLEHLQTHHAVAARLQVDDATLQQLLTAQTQLDAVTQLGVVIIDIIGTEGTSRFGHIVTIIGYNFSSSNASEHYWLIKDSLPGVGAGQYWKLGLRSVVGLGAWIGGFTFDQEGNSTTLGNSTAPGTAPDGVTPDPSSASPSPHPPDTLGVTPGPVTVSPSPEPAATSGTVVGAAAPAAGNSAARIGAAADAAAAVIPPPAIMPLDGSGPTPAIMPLDGSGSSGGAGNAAGSSSSSSSTDVSPPVVQGPNAAGPAIVDPARANIRRRTDIDPNDLVIVDRNPANTLTLMSIDQTQTLWQCLNDMNVLRTSTLASADCQKYATAGACERLSVVWQRMGGELKLQSLIATLADNWAALQGRDISCLPVGTPLSICTR